MSKFPPKFFLLPQEKVLVESRMTAAWAVEHVFASLIVALVVWGGLAGAVFAFRPPRADLLLAMIAVAATLHILLSGVYAWRRVATAEYVVTDEAVYGRRGRLLLHVDAAALDRVTDLHVRTSLFGRLFGYSALSVKTAGGGVYMPGLHDPYPIRGIIQEARHDFLARLLREGGRPEPARGVTAASECECPTCFTAFPVSGQRPVAVECPNCHETGMLFEEVPA